MANPLIVKVSLKETEIKMFIHLVLEYKKLIDRRKESIFHLKSQLKYHQANLKNDAKWLIFYKNKLNENIERLKRSRRL